MPIQTGSPTRAAAVAAMNVFRPEYVRRIAKTTLDWDFERSVRRLARIPFSGLCLQSDELRVPIGPGTWGETPLMDLLTLCALVRLRAPAKIFEFGTFTGGGTLAMAMNAPSAKIITLDLPPQTRKTALGLEWDAGIDDRLIGQSFRQTPYQANISQILCDSRSFDPSPHADSVDFAWVDACHEYDFVKNDSAKALGMINPTGLVAWHDVSRAFPGVVRYLHELAADRKVYWVEGTQVAFICPPEILGS
jgi:predicted O-methyltransferase YrrM